ncbi:type II toxin-antitoxin system YafQ family toxin [bacterium 1xD8-48]|jgi:mRNA interferase YafQ|nr:type II toxin-antitoxin system YafQ family toxin [Lachnospiraceae bacterium]NBJ96466.1 type II toxin-antitoxin system YafQ family toxin [bacterium 1xD8-48]
MLNVRYSTRFKKDFKTCVKRGYKMSLLQQAIDTLRIPAQLPLKNKDHNLSGNYSGYRECHIEPDWLLIYKQTDDELRLDRTGTHTDLFGM